MLKKKTESRNQHENVMNPGEIDLEHKLKELAPASVPEAMLDRFARAMDESRAEVRAARTKVVEVPLDRELTSLEETLGKLVPHGMPENMISRLDDAMSRWHEKVPLEEKVVSLNARAGAERRSLRPGWRAVAAMAVLGIGTAFLTEGNAGFGRVSDHRIPVHHKGEATPVVFTSAPGEARVSVLSTNDHGVMWTEEGLPVRCVEVESENEIRFENRKGEKIIIARPKKEITFTPVKFD
jgi:hypothetical protein